MILRRGLLMLVCFLGSHVGKGQQSIFWEISSPSTTFKSYLFGTYHLLGNSFIDSLAPVLDALEQSELAVFESLEDGSAWRDSIRLRKSTDSLRLQIGNNSYNRLAKLTQAWAVTPSQLTRSELLFKLMQELTVKSCNTLQPTDTWDNLDNYLIHLAQKRNIKTLGLETDAQQLAFLEAYFSDSDTASFRETIQYLTEALESARSKQDRCELVNQYRQLEIDFELLETGDTSFIVKQRNAEWMQVIPNLLRRQRCFIAVGLIHLMYSHGLIQQLRHAGFTLQPIKLQP